ncbi:MAG TPA: GNAT family protein [Roseiflexaceae bacterium]|nr:GNAT family protein [Roseiflexaceae bacterium]
MTKPKLLTGAHVRLTALADGDLPTLAQWYQDAEFLRLFDATPAMPRSESALRQWLAERANPQTSFLFGVRLSEADELIGIVELDGILWNQQVGWLSIGIGDVARRGQGYGAEALRLALDFAFGELNLRRVQLTVFSYNTRAIALYEKLGFQREGAYREFLQRDGQRYDMYLYGLLRREWENREPRTKN